ncbi:hypothetical protein A9G42_10885 [Gilliamella sp. Nev6-6]|uniref:hypothetical protein n=1 Tax=Gilliamella sp. Nev6-6 TaxID=3120252 RepID=UPI00080F39D6|nr:hypothetical protein [Gilliamella apicola]OCG74164.1 hypothetical protein A9G42_10885 [Gilliamella apicola]
MKSDELVRTKEVRTKVRTENILNEQILIEANDEIITTARFHKKMEAAYPYYEDSYNCSIFYGGEFKKPDKGLLFC